MTEIETDLLVVGGGPVGMTCAILAASMGVRTLLIDRRLGVSYYPKARALTARSLEIFRALGIEQAVYDAMLRDHTRFYGAAPNLVCPDMRLIPFGLVGLEPRPDTPATGSFCTQDRLEPILEARLRREPLATVWFGHDLGDIEQDESGVTAIVQGPGQTRFRIRSRFLVGADGAGSECAALAGIAMTRPVELDPALTLIFKAPLSHLIDPLDSVYLLLTNPQSGIGGMLSGVSLARDPEEWSLVTTQLPDWGTTLTEANAGHWRQLVREITGIADLDVTISAVAQWWRTATVAETMTKGRVALAGDSAHLMPPSGGLGLNTGLQDTHNLSWRLAAIVHGSSLSLLEDYDRERRPEATFAVEAAVANYHQGGQMDKIWGRPQAGLSLGAEYAAGTFIADQVPPTTREYPYHDYVPSGRPGARAPHFWLDVGSDRSVLDLFGRGFVLLSERHDERLGQVVERLTANGLPLTWVKLDEHLAETTLAAWRALYGVDEQGTVLVRPDGYVAWRATAREAAELESAFWPMLHNRMGRWSRSEPAMGGTTAP